MNQPLAAPALLWFNVTTMPNASGKPAQTIAITVKVFGGLRQELRAPEQRIELAHGTSLGELLAQIRKNESGFGKRLDEGLSKGYLNILINGRNARFLAQMDTLLNDDDIVAFLPPVGGG